MVVKKGDVVIYDRYSGTNVEYEGEKYFSSSRKKTFFSNLKK